MRKRKKKSPEASLPMMMDEKHYRARRDLDTMRESHEIMGDKGRMNEMKRHARQQMESMRRIERLKDTKI